MKVRDIKIRKHDNGSNDKLMTVTSDCLGEIRVYTVTQKQLAELCREITKNLKNMGTI